MKPREKPASADVINDLVSRINLLIKNGMVTKDFLIGTDEAAIISGLSKSTLRRYVNGHHLSCFAYPGKLLFPLKELCQWVDQHYREATVHNTSEMIGYKSVKMGRPKKRKGL